MRNADMVAPLQMMNEIDDLAQGLLLTEWEMKNKCATLLLGRRSEKGLTMIDDRKTRVESNKK